MTHQERFWKNVDFTDACWLWTGCTHNGYGIFSLEGKSQRAHRLSWGWRYFPIPQDLCIDHLCRVKRCVRPDHLEVVTWAENGRRGNRDAKAVAVPRLRRPANGPVQASLRELPDGPNARAYFERRRSEQGGHWTIESSQLKGTPHLLIDGQLRAAHHLAYAWWVGPLLNDHVVLRTCDQATCVHPEHLTALPRGACSLSNMHGIQRWRQTYGPTAEERAIKAQEKIHRDAQLEEKAAAVRARARQMDESVPGRH